MLHATTFDSSLVEIEVKFRFDKLDSVTLSLRFGEHVSPFGVSLVILVRFSKLIYVSNIEVAVTSIHILLLIIPIFIGSPF